MKLLYGFNADRFTTGREAFAVRTPIFKECGCGVDDTKWDRVTGTVSLHHHHEHIAKPLKTTYRIMPNEFSKQTGVHCPLPFKVNEVWIVPSLCSVS